MAVDEAGRKVATLAVHDLGGLIGRRAGTVRVVLVKEDADDDAVLHGHLAGRDAQAVDVDDLGVGKERVNGGAALGGVNHLLHGADGHGYSLSSKWKADQ